MSAPSGPDRPFFSVVMPTYQRRASLRQTLETLARVEYPRDRMELVLVSDGSTDGSVEMARSLDLPFPLRAYFPLAARFLLRVRLSAGRSVPAGRCFGGCFGGGAMPAEWSSRAVPAGT